MDPTKKKGEKSSDKAKGVSGAANSTPWLAGKKPKGEDPKLQVIGKEHQRFLGLPDLLKHAKTEIEKEAVTTVYERALKEYEVIPLDFDDDNDGSGDDKPEKKPVKKSEKDEKKVAKKAEKEEKEAAKKAEKEEKEAAKKEKEAIKKAEKEEKELERFKSSFLRMIDPVFVEYLSGEEFNALTPGYSKMKAPDLDFEGFVQAFHELYTELIGYLEAKKGKKVTADVEHLKRWHSWTWNEKEKKPTSLEKVKAESYVYALNRNLGV